MSKSDEFLKSQKILRLATVDKKGNPYVVPVWYLYSSKKLYIGTNTRTQKVRNLKRNKNVSFCIDVGVKSPKIFGMMGLGISNLIDNNDQVSKLAKKILLKYFKTLKSKSAKELLEDTNCVIEIIPKKISVWSY